MPVRVLPKVESIIYHPGKSRLFELLAFLLLYSVHFFILSILEFFRKEEEMQVLLGRNIDMAFFNALVELSGQRY